jgi:hypothetical protein
LKCNFWTPAAFYPNYSENWEQGCGMSVAVPLCMI